ncbi:hypothetical protein Fcan01_27553 [Folsomia candida]|uniref:Uncharacterized protein n=1 Tax=Folsomia candida TaxID=158441 RepID=A0A226CYP4_FOLCA|nr:hypothetical protein Fcan01_27553 [Folsomia candida]
MGPYHISKGDQNLVARGRGPPLLSLTECTKLLHVVILLGVSFLGFSWSVCQAQSTTQSTTCVVGDPDRVSPLPGVWNNICVVMCPPRGGCGSENFSCPNGGPLCNRTSHCCQCVTNQCQDTAGCNWMYCPDGETPNCILKREGTHALQVMTENARKTNFLATVLQIMTGIAVRTDHKLQGYVELTDIEKSASVLKRAQQKLVANAQVCRAQVSCTLLTNHFATLHRITVNVLGISYFCRIYKCRNTNDCSMSCPVGKTASCILKKLGSECVCIDDNYCTTNGTELCPFAMFSGASFATYHRYCSDNQSRIPRLCRADRNREECNCAPGCYYTSDCDDGTQATCDTGMHIECINTTCMCHKEVCE